MREFMACALREKTVRSRFRDSAVTSGVDGRDEQRLVLNEAGASSSKSRLAACSSAATMNGYFPKTRCSPSPPRGRWTSRYRESCVRCFTAIRSEGVSGEDPRARSAWAPAIREFARTNLRAASIRIAANSF